MYPVAFPLRAFGIAGSPPALCKKDGGHAHASRASGNLDFISHKTAPPPALIYRFRVGPFTLGAAHYS
jgi:hypothetical protein